MTNEIETAQESNDEVRATTSHSNARCLLYSCRTCLKWIPVGEAFVAPQGDPDGHFCGRGCYEKWSAKLKEMRERST